MGSGAFWGRCIHAFPCPMFIGRSSRRRVCPTSEYDSAVLQRREALVPGPHGYTTCPLDSTTNCEFRWLTQTDANLALKRRSFMRRWRACHTASLAQAVWMFQVRVCNSCCTIPPSPFALGQGLPAFVRGPLPPANTCQGSPWLWSRALSFLRLS